MMGQKPIHLKMKERPRNGKGAHTRFASETWKRQKRCEKTSVDIHVLATFDFDLAAYGQTRRDTAAAYPDNNIFRKTTITSITVLTAGYQSQTKTTSSSGLLKFISKTDMAFSTKMLFSKNANIIGMMGKGLQQMNKNSASTNLTIFCCYNAGYIA